VKQTNPADSDIFENKGNPWAKGAGFHNKQRKAVKKWRQVRELQRILKTQAKSSVCHVQN
jgi:hypothetical protein